MLSLLRASPEIANSRDMLRMLADWIAMSSRTIAISTPATVRPATAATMNATRASAHAAPVAGSDQPRSCSRPERWAASAPASPASPNSPMTETG